ncbi:major facilitator superfamily domain-containing protein [Dactylonectria macrodidyma]|uniref:Major facilitator superfamily domain-containing protein n=1 Tax=Dactylonectria macrodidyma TaxID=307937 RepID=A0A9P9ENF0_9HYPO|nr:major facilitator superfamily domain-containing protein [Dactylonectria macrodidyma]
MISVGAGINGGLRITKDLEASHEQAIWIVASYPLTQGTYVLSGAGASWVLSNLVAGFMRHVNSVSIMRALSGIDAAFVMPNAIALFTINFPPGKAWNPTNGMFGAMAPIGAAGGSVFPGLFGQWLPWWWLFFFLAILGTVVYGVFYFVVESEGQPMDPSGRIDDIGAYCGIAGLFLFNFAWTQTSLVGWSFWEIKVADQPIMPMSIWNTQPFNMMIISAFVSFMSFGTLLWYATVWQLKVRGYNILLNAATFVPLAFGGASAAILSAKILRFIAAQYILAIGSLATLVSLILVPALPEQQICWAQAFLAILVGPLGPDFLFIASQLIASGTVKRSEEGVARTLISTVLAYGLATGLGFAGTDMVKR